MTQMVDTKPQGTGKSEARRTNKTHNKITLPLFVPNFVSTCKVIITSLRWWPFYLVFIYDSYARYHTLVDKEVRSEEDDRNPSRNGTTSPCPQFRIMQQGFITGLRWESLCRVFIYDSDVGYHTLKDKDAKSEEDERIPSKTTLPLLIPNFIITP